MAERQDGLAARLAALPNGPALDTICRGAVEFLDVCAAAVVLMSDGDGGSVAASYGPWITAVDELQFTLGEGPCLSAFGTGAAVFEPDLADARSRWPAFAPAGVAAGVRAVFAVPLQLGAIRFGVLYFVRDTPGPLSDDGTADAYGLAQLATIALLERQHDGQNLRHANGWSHRAVVHQATGMVSVQLDVGLADALARLRARAYVLDRSIYDVASDVVGRRLRFTEDGERGAQ